MLEIHLNNDLIRPEHLMLAFSLKLMCKRVKVKQIFERLF